MADEVITKKRITEYATEVTVDELDNSDVIFIDSTQHGTRKLRLKGVQDAITKIQNEGIKSSGVSVTSENYTTTITDVNNQPVNTIYAYGSGLQSSIANLPSNVALSIMHYTYKHSVATGVGQVMIAIERSGESPAMYFRSTSGSPVAWGSWVKMANWSDLNSSIKSSNMSAIKASNYTNYWDDLNNQPINTVYVYDSDVYSHIANMPPSTHGITIMHYTPNTNAIYGRVMLAVDLAGDNRAMYFRAATSSSGSALWTDWKKIIGIGDNHSNTFYYENEVFSPSFSMTPGIVISNTTGESGSASVTICSDLNYYPMVKDKKYHFWTDDLSYNVYFYDENYNFIRSIYANNALTKNDTIFENTDGYSYFRVSGYHKTTSVGFLDTLHVSMNFNPKKIVCLGDSMTAGNGTTVAYHMYLGRRTGWTCLNWGVGGSGFATNMYASTTVGKGVEGIAPSNVTPDYNTDFVNAVTVIPKDADLYIVYGGYNDWNTDKSETTFTSAVESVINYIQTNMPDARILVMTPPQRYTEGGKDGSIKNSADLTLKEYGEKIMQICEKHAIPYVDLYTKSGLYPYLSVNNSKYYSDGLHPNANGHKLIYTTMYGEVMKLLSLK